MWATGEERREAVGWRARACAGVTLCARARALRPRREHRAPRTAARYQYPINHAWPMRMHARAHAHAPHSCSARTCECPVRTRRPNSQTRLSYAMMTSQRGCGGCGGVEFAPQQMRRGARRGPSVRNPNLIHGRGRARAHTGCSHPKKRDPFTRLNPKNGARARAHAHAAARLRACRRRSPPSRRLCPTPP